MKKAAHNRQSEWFHHWFDQNYSLVYDHRSDAEAEKFVANWRLDWQKLHGKLALDVGCGNGRFCTVLAQRGLKTFGVDISVDQLKLAKDRRRINPKVMLIRADMRQLPVKNQFSLITSLFTSFGYFVHENDHRQLLKEMVDLLLPNGILVIDLPNRDYVFDVVSANPVTNREIDGIKITENRHISSDSLRVEKEIILSGNDRTHHYRESIRLFSPDELLELTGQAGLIQTEALWGDYQEGEMKPNNPRMVYFGRKNG